MTARVCELIRTGKPCRRAGVNLLTVHDWMERGKKAKRGKYRAFHLAVEAAMAELRQLLREKIRQLDALLRPHREQTEQILSWATASRPS
jgi:hypothetical protein